MCPNLLAARAGGSELQYHSLLGNIYASFGVVRPSVERRHSVTVCSEAEVRLLARTLGLANTGKQHGALHESQNPLERSDGCGSASPGQVASMLLDAMQRGRDAAVLEQLSLQALPAGVDCLFAQLPSQVAKDKGASAFKAMGTRERHAATGDELRHLALVSEAIGDAMVNCRSVAAAASSATAACHEAVLSLAEAFSCEGFATKSSKKHRSPGQSLNAACAQLAKLRTKLLQHGRRLNAPALRSWDQLRPAGQPHRIPQERVLSTVALVNHHAHLDLARLLLEAFARHGALRDTTVGEGACCDGSAKAVPQHVLLISSSAARAPAQDDPFRLGGSSHWPEATEAADAFGAGVEADAGAWVERRAALDLNLQQLQRRVLASQCRGVSARTSTPTSVRVKLLNSPIKARGDSLEPAQMAVLCLGGLGGSTVVGIEWANAMAERGSAPARDPVVHVVAGAEVEVGLANNSSGATVLAHAIPALPTDPTSAYEMAKNPLQLAKAVEGVTRFLETLLIGSSKRGGGGRLVLMVHHASLWPFATCAWDRIDRTAAGAHQLRLLLVLHGTDVPTSDRPEYPPPPHINPSRGDMVAAVSDALVERALTAWPCFHRVSIRVVPNAVPTSLFRPARSSMVYRAHLSSLAGRSSQSPSAPPSSPQLSPPSSFSLVFAHSSNFRDVKNPVAAARAAILTARALHLTAGCRVHATLLLIGGGPLLAATASAAEAIAADPDSPPLRVVCTGRLSRVRTAEAIAASDILLVSSAHEGFCLVALEALACGVPIVSTRNGGCEEILRRGGMSDAVAATMLVANSNSQHSSCCDEAALATGGESDGVALALAKASVGLLGSTDAYWSAQTAGVAAAHELEAAQKESFDQLFRKLMEDLQH